MIYRIENTDVSSVWDRAKPMLERCFERTGKNPDSVKEWLEDGTYQLWVEGMFRAVCTTSIDIYPDEKVCTVVHLAGTELWDWLNDIGEIETWARGMGCDRIRINGRKEWSRVLPGYSEVAVVSEKVL